MIIRMIATGPTGSGKSTIVNHFRNNTPDGYRLMKFNMVGVAKQTEYYEFHYKKAKPRLGARQ